MICGLIGMLVRRVIDRPVQHLLEGTRKIAQGDLDCRIPVTSGDELGHLAQSFNKMTEDLNSTRKELNNLTQTLEEEVENKTNELQLAQAQVIRSERNRKGIDRSCDSLQQSQEDDEVRGR